MDLAMAGEEALRVAGRLEPLHVPLSPPGRLVRDLDFVVEISASADVCPQPASSSNQSRKKAKRHATTGLFLRLAIIPLPNEQSGLNSSPPA
jgi:hypothetical protein